jgi:thiamine kinase-like enzyme
MENKKYDTELTKLIKEYKPIMDISMRSYDKIGEYIEKVRELIGDFKYNDAFFHKSYLSLLLPIKKYYGFNNGLVMGNSANCKFTIANIETDKGNKERLFIKIVEDNRQYENAPDDYLIFDILAAIIFEEILKEENNRKYRNLIPEYKGCVLSYLQFNNSKFHWNYNKIRNNYNFINIHNDDIFHKYDKVLLVMYEAIYEPISVLDLFQDFNKNKVLAADVINKYYDIYEFIKYLGLEYGFMHNDLHFGNIIYNKLTKKLMLIDFGRSSFAKYIDNSVANINEKINTDYKKMNYNNRFNIKPDISVNCNKNKVKLLYTNNKLFTSDGETNRFISPMGMNNKYFGVIFDLITFALNAYVRTLYYYRKTLPSDQVDEFENEFSKFIYVNYGDDIDNLVNHRIRLMITSKSFDSFVFDEYLSLRDDYVNEIKDKKTQKHLRMIFEGLSYATLFLYYTKFKYSKIYDYFQIINTSQKELNGFKDFIQGILYVPEYREVFSQDSFLMNFAPVSSHVSGGVVNKKKGLINLKMPVVVKSKETIKVANIKDTVEAYKKIYNKPILSLSSIRKQKK